MTEIGGDILGLWETIDGERTLVFESEQEGMLLNDFLLYALTDENGMTTLETSAAEYDGDSLSYEGRLLLGMSKTRLEFLEVQECAAQEGTVKAVCLQSGADVLLVNQGLSATAQPGLLYFGHLTPLPDFHMTTGAGFLFAPEKKDMLLRRFRRMSGDDADDPEHAYALWKHFLELNRRHGLNVEVR